MKEIGSRHGLQEVPVGEATLSDLQVRPDYAVQVNGAMFPTADGYPQTVTFGPLYARSRGIAFEDWAITRSVI